MFYMVQWCQTLNLRIILIACRLYWEIKISQKQTCLLSWIYVI